MKIARVTMIFLSLTIIGLFCASAGYAAINQANIAGLWLFDDGRQPDGFILVVGTVGFDRQDELHGLPRQGCKIDIYDRECIIIFHWPT